VGPFYALISPLGGSLLCAHFQQGMKHPEPRIKMLDGFNQGWIEFEQNETMRRKGRIGLKEVLTELVRAK
jgi:hypothetical protein